MLNFEELLFSKFNKVNTYNKLFLNLCRDTESYEKPSELGHYCLC